MTDAQVTETRQCQKNDIIKEASAKFEDIDVAISIRKSGDEFYIEKVCVYIYSSGYSLDPDKIDAVCRDRLGVGATIVYK
jgi:hypothetical protein